jgi:hypothetical protein
LSVLVFWQFGTPIGPQFSCNLDANLKWQSGTIAIYQHIDRLTVIYSILEQRSGVHCCVAN